MSKQKRERELPDSCASATLRMLRVSPRKLNLVAQLMRGKHAGQALTELSLAPQRIARDVKKLLMSAIANAENNHNLDVDRLFVTEATVGKHLMMKRLDVRGRSKAGRITKPFSHLRIVVHEKRGML